MTFGQSVDSLPSNSEAKISGVLWLNKCTLLINFSFQIVQAFAAAQRWYLQYGVGGVKGEERRKGRHSVTVRHLNLC